MQNFNFIGKLVQKVSERTGKHQTKERVLNALIKGLVFLFLSACFLLYVACFIFVCITE